MWFTFDGTDACLVAHLGLSGQFRPATPGHPLTHDALTRDRLTPEALTPDTLTHERARISFEDDGPDLVFCDQRTFGGLYLDEAIHLQDAPSAPQPDGGALVPSSICHIALDPFDPNFSPAQVIDRLRRKDVPIKAALLDQTVLSGVGNIYADESLWRSKIHPLARTKRINPSKLNQLLMTVNDVLSEALGSGGTTFDGLYVTVNGESGSFSDRLAAYGRGGKPCNRCGTILRREKYANRSSVRCPKCQPTPKARASKVDS